MQSIGIAMIFMRLGGFSTGKAAHIGELKAYAQTVEKLSLPQDKKSLYRERATHGNMEFQQLKLDIFFAEMKKGLLFFASCGIMSDEHNWIICLRGGA